MFFNARIIITFDSFSSECRNYQMFAHSDLKMTLSFAIIGNIGIAMGYYSMGVYFSLSG